MSDPEHILQALGAWWQPVAIGIAAMLAARFGHLMLLPVLRHASRHLPVLHAVSSRTERSLAWLLPVLALQLVWQGIPDDLAGVEGVRHATAIALIVVFTSAAIAVVHGVVDAVGILHPQDVADNLEARRVMTQTRVLSRIAIGVLLFAGIAFVLMTFPSARQIGASLLASAGLSALVLGLAARSIFGNLLAGLQIALTQPLRIDDVLIIEGEWGRVEEITGTFVVLKIWDERRLVIPLQWFIEHPFQNWTRRDAALLGTVMLWLDYGLPVDALRQEAQRLCAADGHWDGRVCVVQVTDTSERAMQVRVLVSAATSGASFDLRCNLREGLIRFVLEHHPQALPHLRADLREATTLA